MRHPLIILAALLALAAPPAGRAAEDYAAWPVLDGDFGSTGGGGVGRSCSTLYQRVGISDSSRVILCRRMSVMCRP